MHYFGEHQLFWAFICLALLSNLVALVGYVARNVESIEGRDGELTTLFATLCGLKMSANRLHSSSASMYSSQWAARNNNQQPRVQLSTLIEAIGTI